MVLLFQAIRKFLMMFPAILGFYFVVGMFFFTVVLDFTIALMGFHLLITFLVPLFYQITEILLH